MKMATTTDNQNEKNAEMRERLPSVPGRPGVYLFKDTFSKFLYVGKAANLRNRLRSYFGTPHGMVSKIRRLMQQAVDFEFVVTDSESEALILENTLIKRHRPPFNTRLRDDKTYPYIKIDPTEEFPQVYFTRRVLNDGARYFGPFASAGSIRKTLGLLKKLFPYRSCTKTITGTDARPCLEYYIHRCVAPCVGYADQKDYKEVIEQVLMFLEGKTGDVVRQLNRRMSEAAEGLAFEQAARIRDQIQAIERVNEEQKMVSLRSQDMDVVAMAQERNEAWVEAFFIRKGKLVGRDHFIMDGVQDEEAGKVMANFIQQFYDRASYVPPLIVIQHEADEVPLLTEWLTSRRGGPVVLHVPIRGEKRKLVALVAENASQGLSMARIRRLSGQGALDTALAEIQEALSLPRLPNRIECYDISNISGTDAVGSMVVFQNGAPRKEHYRRFKIKTVDGPNDFAMMREMLLRRFARMAAQPDDSEADSSDTEAGEGAWVNVPDLVLIDGGKGHLSAVQGVFLEMGISTDKVPLGSLAKQEEELFVPHSPDPMLLPRNSQGLFLVQRVRDEAHRFAITYHQKLRSKRQTQSGLDTVQGIGPKRRKLLIQRFGSVQGIQDASMEELTLVPGMTVALAQNVKEQL
jgi:excinuclease ABC subunit C